MSSARRRIKRIGLREETPIGDNVAVRRHPKTVVRELKQRIDDVIVTNRRRFGISPRRKIVA